MNRLTWLVGPPGAGKSTFVARQREFERHVEFNAMLAPLVAPRRIRKGVLGAQAKLVEAIRAIELHPDNVTLPPLLVVAGLVPEESLFPLRPHEQVWLLLPERARWQQQLRARPAGNAESPQYDDYDYAAQWYNRFCDWVTRGLAMHHIDVPFDPALIGQSPEA